MRRSLVLTDEAARHPFLSTLPPHVRSSPQEVRPKNPFRRIQRQEIRDFFCAYIGGVIAVSLFIW